MYMKYVHFVQLVIFRMLQGAPTCTCSGKPLSGKLTKYMLIEYIAASLYSFCAHVLVMFCKLYPSKLFLMLPWEPAKGILSVHFL